MDQKPEMLFLVQSGFPEAHHSRYMEKYLVNLCKKLELKSAGVMLRGGIEGIQVQPDWMTKKTFSLMHRLGFTYGATGQLDPELLKKFAGSEKLSPTARFLYRAGKSIGLTNMYWNMQLKKNDAWDNRFDKPYD